MYVCIVLYSNCILCLCSIQTKIISDTQAQEKSAEAFFQQDQSMLSSEQRDAFRQIEHARLPYRVKIIS